MSKTDAERVERLRSHLANTRDEFYPDTRVLLSKHDAQRDEIDNLQRLLKEKIDTQYAAHCGKCDKAIVGVEAWSPTCNTCVEEWIKETQRENDKLREALEELHEAYLYLFENRHYSPIIAKAVKQIFTLLSKVGYWRDGGEDDGEIQR